MNFNNLVKNCFLHLQEVSKEYRVTCQIDSYKDLMVVSEKSKYLEEN